MSRVESVPLLWAAVWGVVRHMGDADARPARKPVASRRLPRTQASLLDWAAEAARRPEAAVQFLAAGTAPEIVAAGEPNTCEGFMDWDAPFQPAAPEGPVFAGSVVS